MRNRRFTRNNHAIHVRDAIIEDIFQDRNNTGFVTISYGQISRFNKFYTQVVRLIVDHDTVIQNQFGQDLLLRNLRKGMKVDADFSSVMTASEPPQARAFNIVVLNDKKPSNIIIDRVAMVDPENSFFITGQPNDINSQIRFQVTPQTKIMNRRGNRISLWDIKVGQMVKVEHASFMTFSIPPQTNAYSVQIL